MNTEASTHARFRVHTVSYYDVALDKLEDHYGTDDPVEAAQIDQTSYRKDGSALFEMLASGEATTEPEIYVQVFDPDGQMFSDEFIREVIQLVRIEEFEIHFYDKPNPDRQVHAHLNGFVNGSVWKSFDGYGRTMGFALRDVREQVRKLTGQ